MKYNTISFYFLETYVLSSWVKFSLYLAKCIGVKCLFLLVFLNYLICCVHLPSVHSTSWFSQCHRSHHLRLLPAILRINKPGLSCLGTCICTKLQVFLLTFIFNTFFFVHFITFKLSLYILQCSGISILCWVL